MKYESTSEQGPYCGSYGTTGLKLHGRNGVPEHDMRKATNHRNDGSPARVRELVSHTYECTGITGDNAWDRRKGRKARRTRGECDTEHATRWSPVCAQRPDPLVKAPAVNNSPRQGSDHRTTCAPGGVLNPRLHGYYPLGVHGNIRAYSYVLKSIALQRKRKLLILSLDISRIFSHYKLVLSLFATEITLCHFMKR